MDKSTRWIFWVLVALVLLSSFSTVWFFLGKEDLYKEYIKLQDTLKTTIERFTSELKVSNNERLKVQEKLDELYVQLKAMKKERDELESSHKEAVEQNDSLKKELARLSKEGTDLRKKIKDLESEEFLATLIRENAALQVKVEKLNIQALEENLKNVEIEKGLLEERLKEQTKIAEVITQDLLREKNIRIELQKNLAKLNEDYSKAAKEAQDARFRISSLESAIREKEDEIERIRISLRKTQEARAEAYKRPERDITGRTTESVELPPIVVSPERTEIAKAHMPDPFGRSRSLSSNTKGKIITVNREHNFVVIDLGEKDGVRIGTRFSVYRGGLELGALEVIQTRERIAAADIKEENSSQQILPDDVVVMQ